ncbi:MAG: hypothetical protein NDJ90_05710 [Oligoflexia bacterium]|nr:hypothetical protein [Oligoflexia bacterium]
MALLPVLLVILGMTASAAEPVLNFSCSTGVSTVTVATDTSTQHLDVSIVHHVSTKRIAVMNGLVSGADIPLINENAFMISHLGSVANFRFPIARCYVTGPRVFACFSGDKTRMGIKEVIPSSLYSVRRVRETFSATSEAIELTAVVTVDGKLYPFVMEYPGDQCLPR